MAAENFEIGSSIPPFETGGLPVCSDTVNIGLNIHHFTGWGLSDFNASMNFSRIKIGSISETLDVLLLGLSSLTFVFWFSGKGLFYSADAAVLSPFTSFSLLLMTLTRINRRYFSTWSTPMTLALLGVVACGNLSSIWIHWISPDLFLKTMPSVVPTSVLTSVGLILFCCYEGLISLRKTPQSAFILDDILLHLALFPGSLSLMGHVLGVPAYVGSEQDPRVGIGYPEMLLMGTYAVSAVCSNPDLFLWKFLRKSIFNRLVFLILFVNQYVAPFLVGFVFRNPSLGPWQYGLEFFVMLAGVLAVLIFLSVKAFDVEEKKVLTGKSAPRE